MHLQHRFTVPAPVDETWAAFNDLERVAPCFPGATLTSVDGDAFAGTVKIKLGPISMQYSGTGTFLERDEANHQARFEAKGKDKRGNGTAAATVTALLTAEGDATLVDVSTELSITGKPAQFGRGVIQDVSDKLLGKFTGCLVDKLASPDGGLEVEEPPVEEPAPAPVESATAQPDQPVAPPPTPPSPPQPSAPEDEGLDLFRTVAPVLVRRYALPVGGGLLALVVLVRVIRLIRR